MKSITQDTETSGKKTDFLGLYLKIFDHSLGGYYHRERWMRTQQYYQQSYSLMIKGKDNLFEPILETRFRL
jgi:hypothetical protein